MQNLEMEVKGTKLTITVDLAKSFGRSGSGKNVIIATTAGNVVVAPGISAGINIYRKPKQGE